METFMKKYYTLFILFIISTNLLATAHRAAHLADAKERLDTGKADAVAILIHGSDWCPAGEVIKTHSWASSEVTDALPNNVILSTKDVRETPPKNRGPELKKILANKSTIPLTTTPPTTKHGTKFRQRKDDAWVIAKGTPNPNYEVISITIKLKRPAQLLRLSTLTDPAIRHGGPGRTRNFVITEFEARINGVLMPFWSAASFDQKGFPGIAASDGIITNENGWAIGQQYKDQELYLVPDTPLPAGVDINITIHSIHHSVRHTLGCFKIEAFENINSLPSLAERQRGKLYALSRAINVSTNNYPAIIIQNARGQQLGGKHALDNTLTSTQIIEIIQKALSNRKKAKAYLKKAETLTGEAQITAYAKAFLLLREMGNSQHKEILKTILKLDPKRQSPWTWQFAPDWKIIYDEKNKQMKANNKLGAINALSRMLQDPRLAKLTPHQKQSILLDKQKIYQGWKGHENSRWPILKQMWRTDPKSMLGIGAKGVVDMSGKGEPSIAFGWWPHHIKNGEQTLKIKEGIKVNIFRPGFYTVSFWTASSSKPVKVSSVSLFSGTTLLSKDVHEASLARKADKESIFKIECPNGINISTLTLQIKINAPEGHNHRSGRIYITPYLPADGPFGWRKK